MSRSRIGLVRNYGVTQRFSCVCCERSLSTGERGLECETCLQWPLCGACYKQHERVNGFNAHPKPGSQARE